MNKNKIIIIYSLVVCILLYLVENVFHPTYIIQMIQKIVSFVLIPVIFHRFFSKWKFWKINKKSFSYWINLWLLWALIISITYLLLQNYIDWNAINASLESRGVTITTFIFIFSYIMFWNSLVEEYFFRWVVFNSLEQNTPKFAYIYSSILFSLYHITLFWTRFKWAILWLALFWLFMGALFFAWLYKKTKWIWWAWIFHILADLSILVIGYIELFK